MKRNLHLKPRLATLVLAVAALPAVASSDCDVPAARWQSREAVRQMAAQQGWQVERLKIDDGCYEIRGTDAQGQRFKARIGISNGLVCEKPGKPDSALGGQPMPAWMAWNWRLGRCLVWIRPALTARLALVGP